MRDGITEDHRRVRASRTTSKQIRKTMQAAVKVSAPAAVPKDPRPEDVKARATRNTAQISAPTHSRSATHRSATQALRSRRRPGSPALRPRGTWTCAEQPSWAHSQMNRCSPGTSNEDDTSAMRSFTKSPHDVSAARLRARPGNTRHPPLAGHEDLEHEEVVSGQGTYVRRLGGMAGLRTWRDRPQSCARVREPASLGRPPDRPARPARG